MQRSERHAPLRAALRRQMAISVAAMRDFGMGDRDIWDATGQARAALGSAGRDERYALEATPLVEAIVAQVQLSELFLRELGLSEPEILDATAPGRMILDS